MKGTILVADDGSPCATAAVEWATREATIRGCDLRVLGPFADGDAPAQIVAAATPDDVVVVGAVGAGTVSGLGGNGFGSTAQGVVRASPSPVVVVPPGPARGYFHRVVIGVDGSASSAAALEWAADEADLRGAELVIVHAWWHARGDGGIGDAQSRDLARVDAALVLDAALDAARARAAAPIRGVLLTDGAARALLTQADDADLVVVGSRGGAAVRSMLFGSVAQSVLERSPCPVVSCATRPTSQAVAGVAAAPPRSA